MDWEKVKNWVFGGAGAVALVVFYQFMQWQVSEEVSRQLAARDLGTDTNIVAIKSDVQENTRTGQENAEDIEQNRENVKAAFEALMKE
jgi:hypothetical protein